MKIKSKMAEEAKQEIIKPLGRLLALHRSRITIYGSLCKSGRAGDFLLKEILEEMRQDSEEFIGAIRNDSGIQNYRDKPGRDFTGSRVMRFFVVAGRLPLFFGKKESFFICHIVENRLERAYLRLIEMENLPLEARLLFLEQQQKLRSAYTTLKNCEQIHRQSKAR